MTHHITRKSTQISYFSAKRVHLTYEPLAKPRREYALWWIENGGETGIECSKREYDATVAPETIYDSPAEREAWQRQMDERQRQSEYRSYTSTYNWGR